ncbi:hypothetical protein BH09SUM1_BH09SUM1_01340 [soil metagenome]
MHNHDENAPKEKSSLFIFVPLVLIGVYAIYMVTTIPFRTGFLKGQHDAVFTALPVPENDGKEVFDQKTLVVPSKDLIELGAKVFAQNCVTCHGAGGLGDGSAGAKLAVKPRDYHAPDGVWKNGTSALKMYSTLEKGVGNMSPFPALNPKQKYAVIHYIHATFMKDRGWTPTTPVEIAALPAPAGAVKIEIDPYAETRVPVEYIIRKWTTGQSGNAPTPTPAEAPH